MKPNADKRNSSPVYLRKLVDRTGLSQQACARAMGVKPRLFRRYLRLPPVGDYLQAPYPVQFALECLAASKPRKS